jgi:type IV secretory pathway VirB10-like protein
MGSGLEDWVEYSIGQMFVSAVLTTLRQLHFYARNPMAVL